MISDRTTPADLGPGDQQALSDYGHGSRTATRQPARPQRRRVPDAPVGELEDFDKQLKMMFVIAVIPGRLDAVATVMAAEGTNRRIAPS
jgi:hypothetical protein